MFLGGLTIAINGFTMVFDVATIAFNGFRWFRTIGQTMRWFRWIVVVQAVLRDILESVYMWLSWLTQIKVRPFSTVQNANGMVNGIVQDSPSSVTYRFTGCPRKKFLDQRSCSSPARRHCGQDSAAASRNGAARNCSASVHHSLQDHNVCEQVKSMISSPKIL